MKVLAVIVTIIIALTCGPWVAIAWVLLILLLRVMLR